MILQALYELAHREGLMEDPDFEWRPLAWLIIVGSDGDLLGIHGTHTLPEEEEGKGKKKPKPRPKSFPIPREPGRAFGDRAFFLFDKAEYALGLDPETDPSKRRPPDKLAARFALFRDRAQECLAATDDEGVRAVCRLLGRIAAGEISVSLPEGCASNDLFGFVYQKDGDRLVTSRPKVQEYWRSLRARLEAPDLERRLCLVSNRLAVPMDKMPGIKNVPGGTGGGVALVSFNASAFESYGWSGNDNVSISREAAEATATALNRLLHPAFPDPNQPGQTLPSRHLRLSADTAVCFWAAGDSGDDLASQLAALFDVNPEQVRNLYRSLWQGEPVLIEDPSLFYALTLSGAQGRAIVRDWLEETVGKVSEHLAQHFADLAIARNTPPPKGRELPPALPLRVLVRSLAVRGAEKDVPAALAGQVVRAALDGTPYPFGVLQRALERTRAEIGRDEWSDLERRDARAALIKAVLVRRRRARQATTFYPEINATMDLNNMTPGYRLGRLMAVLERMQETALGEVGASVVDRFFGSASATPAVVFPRLLKGFRHHARKAKDREEAVVVRRAGALEREADEILAPVLPFPTYLTLEEQGLFVLGYHHQRHSFFQTREERERSRKEQDLAASAADL
ncbi:MAG TPA: type I-C CRISPR-associated protein Cas8c/Csd1 [Thermoanaerobaculia bacterium]|nr:type I-C CRISPR-associated protein Cas8c/Csd1 [Thermoanaerobaculia bacterium]